MNLTEREPLALRAAITAAVTALVHVAAVYGLVGDDAEVAIGTAIDALGLLVLIVWARAGVTANAKVIARVTTAGEVVAGDAAVLSTGTELPVTPTPAGGAIADVITVKPDLVNADEQGAVNWLAVIAVAVVILAVLAVVGSVNINVR